MRCWRSARGAFQKQLVRKRLPCNRAPSPPHPRLFPEIGSRCFKPILSVVDVPCLLHFTAAAPIVRDEPSPSHMLSRVVMLFFVLSIFFAGRVFRGRYQRKRRHQLGGAANRKRLYFFFCFVFFVLGVSCRVCVCVCYDVMCALRSVGVFGLLAGVGCMSSCVRACVRTWRHRLCILCFFLVCVCACVSARACVI